MALTSDDVVNYPLKHGMRGYVIAQVDELLDEVADELDRLHGEIEQLKSDLDEARQQAHEARLEVERRADAEGELRRVLLRAETAAEEAMQEAQVEADDVVKGARLQAEQILDEARESARRERDEVLADLDAQEARFRVRKRELMTRVERLQEFENESRRLLRGLLEDQLARLESPEIVDGIDEIVGTAIPTRAEEIAADAGVSRSDRHVADLQEGPFGDVASPDDGGGSSPGSTATTDDSGSAADAATDAVEHDEGRDVAAQDVQAPAEPRPDDVAGESDPDDRGEAASLADELLDDLDDVMLLGDDPSSGDVVEDEPQLARRGRRRRDRSMIEGA